MQGADGFVITNILNDLEVNGSIIFEGQKYDRDIITKLIDKMFNCIRYQFSYVHDMTIAIALNRGIDYAIADLMALKYGITFINLDLTWPAERINYILSDANVTAVISNKQCDSKIKDCNVLYIDDYKSFDIKETDAIKNEIAYILYTSGTTGKPKGVVIKREGLYWFIKDVSKKIDFGYSSTMACFSNQTFDIFFLELFLGLLIGKDIILGDDVDIVNPRRMITLLKQNNVDILQMTPSKLRMIQTIDKDFSFLERVKILMMGGEQFPYSLLVELKKHKNVRIFNMYGPTETTIWSTIAELTNRESVTIGTPLGNTTIYILDENNQVVEDGIEGEIAIGGKGLGVGYVNNQRLSDERFIFLDNKQRVYLTGDIGKKVDGEFICLGRRDSQVKINGHRIELEEIDSLLGCYELIENVVTCYANNKMVTFYTASEEVNKGKIIDYLKCYVPNYMIPTNFVHVDKILLTSSGKSDRSAMMKLYGSSVDDSEPIVKEESPSIYSEVIKTISDCLETEICIDPNMKITELGMDSIQFITIVVEMEEQYNIVFDDDYMLLDKYDTIADFVEYIERKTNDLG